MQITQTVKTNSQETKVIILSSRKLNSDEISLLSKGLKFTPSPMPNIPDLKNDIHSFTRKLRLGEFFEENTGSNENSDSNVSSDIDSDDSETPSLVRNKSDFNPPHNRDKHLERYIDYIHNYPLEAQNTKQNLPRGQQEALRSLQKDDSIVIKEADKGGSVVIMDREYYKCKINTMLNDNTYYSEVRNPRSIKTIDKIKSYTTKWSEEMTEHEADYVTNFDGKPSQFYSLPKVHKSQEILKKISEQKSEYIELYHPDDLTFRPIVGGPHCETHRISNYIDIILKPLLDKVDSFGYTTPFEHSTR